MSNDMIKPYAEAADGTIFNFTSPEVQAYAEAFRLSTVDDVLGSVVGIYNSLCAGAEVAVPEENGDAVREVIALCKARIPEKTEESTQ